MVDISGNTNAGFGVGTAEYVTGSGFEEQALRTVIGISNVSATEIDFTWFRSIQFFLC